MKKKKKSFPRNQISLLNAQKTLNSKKEFAAIEFFAYEFATRYRNKKHKTAVNEF